jgi:hypothetical protein
MMIEELTLDIHSFYVGMGITALLCFYLFGCFLYLECEKRNKERIKRMVKTIGLHIIKISELVPISYTEWAQIF